MKLESLKTIIDDKYDVTTYDNQYLEGATVGEDVVLLARLRDISDYLDRTIDEISLEIEWDLAVTNQNNSVVIRPEVVRVIGTIAYEDERHAKVEDEEAEDNLQLLKELGDVDINDTDDTIMIRGEAKLDTDRGWKIDTQVANGGLDDNGVMVPTDVVLYFKEKVIEIIF